MDVKYVLIFLTTLFLTDVCYAQQTKPSFDELAPGTSDTQRLNVYRSIYGHFRNTNTDSARHYLEQGLKEFTQSNYAPGKAAMLGMLSGTYSEMGMHEDAELAANECLELYTAMDDRAGIAKISNSLGVLEGKKGHYDVAIRHFIQALRYFESNRDTVNIVNTYVKLGTANSLSGNFEKGVEYAQKGLYLSLKTKTSANTAYLYNNLGTMYAEKGMFDKALPYFTKALAISNNPSFVQARMAPLMNIGNIHAHNGDTAKALAFLRQALGIAKSTGSKEEEAKLEHSIAILEEGGAHYSDHKLDDVLQQAVTSGNKSNQLHILTDMANLAHKQGDYKSEVLYLKQASAVRDSLFSIEKAKEIANLQASYELDKSNRQLAALKVSEQENLEKRNVIVVIAFILMLSLITVFLFFLRGLRLNKKLSVRELELQKANATKDRLFSILGHDLKGPLANIPVLLNIYKDKQTTSEEKKQILDSFEENSLASLETLDKLLNWGKLQIKGTTLKQEVFDVAPVMDNKMRLLKVAASNKNITIVNRIPDQMYVYADENHFQFVMRNLLSNAVKYTKHDGTVEINAEKHVDGRQIIFSVQDNGVGISPDRLQHIFEPYNQSTIGTAQELGNSIGLMLCKEFVLQNGGNIWVNSQEGMGATFHFTMMAGNTTDN